MPRCPGRRPELSSVLAGSRSSCAGRRDRLAPWPPSGGQLDRRGLDRGSDAAEPSEPSEPVGPLGGRSLAGRPRRAERAGARHPRLGPLRLRASRLRLLARPPGTDRLAPGYIIVGLDELEAMSPRARTLNALLVLRGDAAPGLSRLSRRSDGRRSPLSLPPAQHLGRTDSVSYGSLWERWARGVNWTWINEHYRARLPERLRRDRHVAREPRSVPRQARPLDGAGGLESGRSTAGRLSEAAFSAALAREAGRALRPGGPALAGRGGMGPSRARASARDRRARGRRRRRTHRPADRSAAAS